MGIKGDLKEEIFNEINENVKVLEKLFPSAVKDGQVDFQALKEELGQFEEVGPEKYGLTWSGKQNAKKIAQQDIVGKTLKYIPEDSKNPETTENLYIEGDNLEVLKLLRQNYYGAIKMIYIDPPYNTGNDFVYKDSFSMDKTQSDIEEGDISELGERYTVNSKSTNKYHANWLNMMYPRLKVAKDLLKDEGVIFISIDENEVDNLRKVCDEIFGESNFVNQIVWIRNSSGKTVTKQLTVNIEYLLIYAKTPNYSFNPIYKPLSEATIKSYSKDDNDGRGKYCTVSLQKTKDPGPETTYEYVDNTGKLWRCPAKGWRMIQSKVKKLEDDGRLYFEGDTLRVKMYWNERESKGKLADTLWDDMPENSVGSKEVSKLFENKIVFSNPKPIKYLERLLEMQTDNESIILDFFSGSSSLAHAVMQLNANDNCNRKYIMVQIPEKINYKEVQLSDDKYRTICEIGKERIRRAGDKIIGKNKDKEGIKNLDIGFKVFRVGNTNIRWNYESNNLDTAKTYINYTSKEGQGVFADIAATKQMTLEDGALSYKDDIDFMPGFKDIDVVYEILLRQRDIPLSAKVELLEDIGQRTYIFADSYLVCLEENITNELIEKIAAINPLPIKFVFRDSAFEDDISLKDETNRRLNALIERNSGGNKKAYTVEFI